jgi:hypothetical protein
MPRLPSQLTYNDLNGSEAIEILTDWFRQLLQSQPQLQPHLTLPMARIGLNVGVRIDMFIGGTVPVESPPEELKIEGGVTLENRLSGEPQIPIVDPRRVESNLSTVVNVAPIPGGNPPDKVREQHGLPISRPGYGSRETGSHLFLADVVDKYEQKRVESPTGGREGIVADGYVFSSEPAAAGKQASVVGAIEQTIPIDRGEINIDLTGKGRMRQGDMVVTAGSHVASKKVLGDQGGHKYGSVAGTYDAGPAGLAQSGRGGGLYRDGRSRISFGNER